MHDTTLERFIWALIYGGLLTLSLGTFVRRQAGGWGISLMAGGGAAAALGFALILVRARRGTSG